MRRAALAVPLAALMFGASAIAQARPADQRLAYRHDPIAAPVLLLATPDTERESRWVRLQRFQAGIETERFRMRPGAVSGYVLTVDAEGDARWQSVAATVTSVQDNLFDIIDDADNTKKAQFQVSGISTGTTRTFTFPNVSSTLAVLGLAQTFTAAQIINPGTDVKPLVVKAHAGETQDWFRVENSAATAFLRVSGGSAPIGTKGEVVVGDGATVLYPIIFRTYSPTYGWGAIYDGTNSVTLTLDAAPTGTPLAFPGAGGTVVTTLATQTLSNKEIETNSYASTGTSILSGFHFRDNSTTTKRLYVQTNAGFAGSHVLKIGATTAARTYTLPDATGNFALDAIQTTFTKRQRFDGEGTTAAAVEYTQQTAPTTPVDGDLWHDSTRDGLQMYTSDITQGLAGVTFTDTASVTVANTTTETNLVGSGIGTVTMPANFLEVGKTLRVSARGTMQCGATGADTLRIRLYIGGVGGTVLFDTDRQQCSNSANSPWETTLIVTCRATGASGIVAVQGTFRQGASGSGPLHAGGMNDRGQSDGLVLRTVDTTASGALALSARWGNAVATNTITLTHFVVEVLN